MNYLSKCTHPLSMIHDTIFIFRKDIFDQVEAIIVTLFNLVTWHNCQPYIGHSKTALKRSSHCACFRPVCSPLFWVFIPSWARNIWNLNNHQKLLSYRKKSESYWNLKPVCLFGLVFQYNDFKLSDPEKMERNGQFWYYLILLCVSKCLVSRHSYLKVYSLYNYTTHFFFSLRNIFCVA